MDLYSRPAQLAVDGLIIASAFALAYIFRFEGLPPWKYTRQMLVFLPYLVAGRLLVNWWLGIYRFIWRYVSLSDAIAIARAFLPVTALLLALRFLYPDSAPFGYFLNIPAGVIILEFQLSLTGCLAARALRRILYYRQAGRPSVEQGTHSVLLVGAGSVGAMVARELASSPGIRVAGFLDDDVRKVGSVVNGIRVLGPTTELEQWVRKSGADQVVICIRRIPREALRRLWAQTELLPVQTKTVPTLEEIVHGKVRVTAFRDVQMEDILGRETADTSLRESEVAALYRDRRILITGAGGSIGSELARQLARLSPSALILLDKDENGLNDIQVELAADPSNPPAHPVIADIRSAGRMQHIFDRFRPEIVFHAAAHKHVPLMEMNPSEAVLNNVTGTRRLVELCELTGVSRFVLISTDKAVRPVSVMGATKRICEMIVQARGGDDGLTQFSCVRFGNVMGSRGSVIPLFRRQIERGGPVTVTHPEVQRYLMTIPEAVCLLLQAGTLGRVGEVFVLDMGDPVPILNLARDLIELSGLRPGQDVRIETTQLRPGEKLLEELVDTSIESLVPTRFSKISMVVRQPFDARAFMEKVVALEEAALRDDAAEIAALLRHFGIGYEPQTSPLEALERIG